MFSTPAVDRKSGLTVEEKVSTVLPCFTVCVSTEQRKTGERKSKCTGKVAVVVIKCYYIILILG